MVDFHIYERDNTYQTFKEAKEQKANLKIEGFRVKIRKSEVGFEVYKKNREQIDAQNMMRGG